MHLTRCLVPRNPAKPFISSRSVFIHTPVFVDQINTDNQNMLVVYLKLREEVFVSSTMCCTYYQEQLG